MASEHVLFSKWKGSQVFMYPKKAEKNVHYIPIPICFGNLVTPKYVLTAITCFINEKGWQKFIKGVHNLKKKFLYGDFLRSGIGKFIFVMVNQTFDI